MHFERTHRRHKYYGVGDIAGIAAFDIEEFFHAHIRTKARFGDHIVR